MAVAPYRPLGARVGRVRPTLSHGGISPAYERNVRRQMNAVLREYRRWAEHVRTQGPEVLREALVPTFYKARDVYTPEDTGDLRDSGYLEAGRSSKGSFVVIGFGRRGFPHYAALVHERTDFFHQPPTRSKFLQAALEEDGPEIQARIEKGYRTASGLGGIL